MVLQCIITIVEIVIVFRSEYINKLCNKYAEGNTGKIAQDINNGKEGAMNKCEDFVMAYLLSLIVATILLIYLPLRLWMYVKLR